MFVSINKFCLLTVVYRDLPDKFSHVMCDYVGKYLMLWEIIFV